MQNDPTWGGDPGDRKGRFADDPPPCAAAGCLSKMMNDAHKGAKQNTVRSSLDFISQLCKNTVLIHKMGIPTPFGSSGAIIFTVIFKNNLGHNMVFWGTEMSILDFEKF